MLVQKIAIPQNSLINAFQVTFNYTDSYAIIINQPGSVTPESFDKNFFSNFPKWVHFLMYLRNVLVKPFKISSDGDFDNIPFEPVQIGSQFSFLTVQDFNDQELLLFAPDHHLNTWISIIVCPKASQTELTATTVVKFNNLTGKVYFRFIRPFHKLIVRTQLKCICHLYQSNLN
jgi:hypothetical protein